MVIRMRFLLTGALALVIGGQSTAVADPIIPQTGTLRIASGQLFFDQSSDDRVVVGRVSGAGFALSVDFESSGLQEVGKLPSFDVIALNPASLSLTIGSATLDNGIEEFQAALKIRARNVVGPDEDVRLNYRFSLNGVLSGQTEDGTLYRYNVHGTGRGLTGFVGPSVTSHRSFTSLTFGAPAPTPEPATVLFGVFGAAALAIHHRRTRGSVSR
jgi:hypothetical protein